MKLAVSETQGRALDRLAAAVANSRGCVHAEQSQCQEQPALHVDDIATALAATVADMRVEFQRQGESKQTRH